MSDDLYRDDQADAAERGLLACALDAPALARQAPADVFAHHLHRELWMALQTLAELGQAPDPATLAPHVRDVAATMPLVVSLMGRGLPPNVPAYLDVVRDRAARRRLDDLAAGLRQRAADLQHPAAAAAQWAATELASEPEDAPQGRSTAWGRVDLGPTVAGLLDGSLSRPAPTVGRIAGGSALLYRGKVNGLAGESGAGKTWTALAAAVQTLDDGDAVLYVDHEDDAVGIVGRLLDLGAQPGDVRQRFAYLNPCQRPTAADLVDLVALVAELRPVLAVVDSTGEGLALDGANPNADEEVAAWFSRVPRRLASVAYGSEPGPAVLVLDHVTKTDDAGLWPIGSQRKRAAISGAQYMQRVVKPFSQDTAGAAVLVCAKDRGGNYRAGQRVAELTVAPGPDGGVQAELVTVTAPGGQSGPWRPTYLMERVSLALEKAHEDGEGPLSGRAITDRVRGKKDHVSEAAALLVEDGYATAAPGPRNSTLHTLKKPYRQADAPGDTQPPQSTVDCPRPLERGTGDTHSTAPGGQSGDTGGHSPDEPARPTPSAGFHCHDCGTPIPSGRVRCQPCAATMTGRP